MKVAEMIKQLTVLKKRMGNVDVCGCVSTDDPCEIYDIEGVIPNDEEVKPYIHLWVAK